ncbi:MAG: hypothetical protein HXY40_11940 [Chloroflexi bacterium]|nr:hypothetical protein [Chloroflexota bacterium]
MTTSARTCLWLAGLVFLLLSAPFGSPLHAQTLLPQQVFLRRDIDASGRDQLLFIDTLTGTQTVVEVTGERYTIAGREVLFFDTSLRRVRLAADNGNVRDHPFMLLGLLTRRVDWVLSPDGTLIAWTMTEGDSQSNLSTITTVANLDGTQSRQVLVDGPRSSLRALPVAFSDDLTRLYMDYQPDGIGDLTPFTQYAGLFVVEITPQNTVGTPQYLPGEPGCFCGGGIGSGWFLRLSLTADLSRYDLRAYNLLGGGDQMIPALALRGYTQAGDFLIAPDGTRAVYALAQVEGFGTAQQSVQTVLALVDLQALTQTTLGDPITTFVHPVAWTEDNSAVIFTTPERDGTWKINLSDNVLTKLADVTYLGTLAAVF